MEMAQAVGLAIRRVRQQQGYSQEALADVAGLDRTYVSGLERGHRNPALSTLMRLVDPLDLRLSRLFMTAERIRSGQMRVSASPPPRQRRSRG